MNETNQNPPQTQETSALSRGKRVAFLCSLAMIGAVLWPVQQNWRAQPRDNFPLSYYPMFSAKREAIETFHYLVGRDADGKRYLIPHTFFGSGGLNAVRRQINKLIREGRAEEIVRRVSKRLAARERGDWAKIISVAVVTGRYSVDDYFHGKKEPVSEKIRASGPVERSTE